MQQTLNPTRKIKQLKEREIYKNFKLVNWDDKKLKSYNRAAERRRHHYNMKTYDPFYVPPVKKERKGGVKR